MARSDGSSSEIWHGNVVYRERGRACVACGLAVAMVLLAALAISSPEAPANIPVAIACLLLAAPWLAIARQKIVISAGELKLVYPFRTVRVAANEVGHLAVELSRWPWVEKTARPVAVLLDGRRLRLPALQPFRFLAAEVEEFPRIYAVAASLRVRVLD
jgi:hypothetical protein